MGLAAHLPPVYVEIKSGADPVKVCQYPTSPEVKKGITLHIRLLLVLGVLRPVQLTWNTPLLPAKKPHTNDYKSAHDLKEVNKRVLRPSGIKTRDGPQKIINLVSKCKAHQLTNAVADPKGPGIRLRGKRSGAYWEADFTEVKPGKYGYKYLLVFTDTVLGWTEAFPTKHETAQVMANICLLCPRRHPAQE